MLAMQATFCSLSYRFVDWFYQHKDSQDTNHEIADALATGSPDGTNLSSASNQRADLDERGKSTVATGDRPFNGV